MPNLLIADNTPAGAWSPSNYSLIRVYENAPDFSQPFTFSININVRSVHDPYVFANFITNGTLSFGSSLSDKIQTGIALLVVGFFLALASLFFSTIFIFKLEELIRAFSRKRKRQKLASPSSNPPPPPRSEEKFRVFSGSQRRRNSSNSNVNVSDILRHHHRLHNQPEQQQHEQQQQQQQFEEEEEKLNLLLHRATITETQT